MVYLVIALGIAAFLLLYFAFNLDNEHWPLKLFIIFIFLTLLVLIGKAALDNKDYCSIVITNSTYNDTTEITSYEYQRVCSTNTNSTTLFFYKDIIFFISCFCIYIFIYFVYKVFSGKNLFTKFK